MLNFANQLKDGLNRIVPVVCDDMFEYVESPNDVPIPIREFICCCLGLASNSSLYKTINKSFYYGISLYESKDGDISRPVYDKIQKAVDEGKIKIKDCVREFLLKGEFPLIITTFPFSIIEKYIEEYTKTEVCRINFEIDSRNDIPLVFERHKHIVYHIFGGDRADRWVYNEQTLLKYMYALQGTDVGAKNLVSYICPGDKEMRTLLVMGSVLPDWLFRFLVYPIYKGNLKRAGGFWISSQNTAQELTAFLKRNGYRFPDKKESIPNVLHQIVDSRVVNRENKNTKQYRIYVSYKRNANDKRLVRLIEMLKMYGLVWVDLEKVADGGNKYWRNIKEAIRLCDKFVPLVTEKYKKEFAENQLDFEQFIQANPCTNEDDNNANDNNQVKSLKPIMREAYYAMSFKKNVCPIVLSTDSEELGNIEQLASDGILPKDMFSETNILLYNDNCPTELNIKFND